MNESFGPTAVLRNREPNIASQTLSIFFFREENTTPDDIIKDVTLDSEFHLLMLC
jgi:hypothetical protein